MNFNLKRKHLFKFTLLAVDLCLILIVLSVAKNLIVVSSAEKYQKPTKEISEKYYKKFFSSKVAKTNFKPKATPSLKTQVTTNQNTEAEIMLSLINAERTSRGQNSLTLDSNLTKLAETHSRDMVQRNFFSHTNPDNNDPFKRLSDAGIEFQTAGENIAFAPTTKIAHENLMKSQKHKDNILSSSFSKIGIGVTTETSNKSFYTQIFTN